MPGTGKYSYGSTERWKIDITIRDNGSGMEEEKRRLIQSYIEGTDQTGIHSDSIGLKNVIEQNEGIF